MPPGKWWQIEPLIGTVEVITPLGSILIFDDNVKAAR
jgi:hypothetical protein